MSSVAPRPILTNAWGDFLLLGGSTVLLLPLMWLLLQPGDDTKRTVSIVMMLLANFINHPHFAHSYQIFYDGFARKVAFGPPAHPLRVRYLLAGIVIPVVIGSALLAVLVLENARLLALAYNLMTFLVGWHYVKQGYGIALVDAAFQRRSLTDAEKTWMRLNGYACWLAAWFGANLDGRTGEYFGLKHQALDLPDGWVLVARIACGLTTIGLMIVFGRRVLRGDRSVPWRGLAIYAITLYLWVVLIHWHPLFVFVAPALHSLQYLTIVWRRELGRRTALAAATESPMRTPGTHMLRFSLKGLVLGFAGFWALPVLLDAAVPYDKTVMGPTAFVFTFWIFINVHHYFLDNVMWRRENEETRRFLFGPSR